MPIHPSPPEDLAGLVDAFRQTVQAVVDLGNSCGPDDFGRDTPCPGWTVQDHISHVAAVEAFLEGGRHPQVDLSDLGHVRHEFGEWMEQGVHARRGTSGREVVAELETLLHNRLATLADPDLTVETVVNAPMDSTLPLAALLRLRVMDIWTHEQDLREVLGRPGGLDAPGACVFLASLEHSFPVLAAKRMDLPEGTAVILDCSGPVTGRIGVRMTHEADGRPWAHALFAGDTETQPDAPPVEGPTTTIVLSTDALTRRAAGRRSTGDTAYHVVGDEDLAARVLDALVITP